MTFKELIMESSFRDKINCILPVLEKVGIDNWQKLQNLPVLVSNFCGVDVYQFVQEMNILIEIGIREEEE